MRVNAIIGVVWIIVSVAYLLDGVLFKGAACLVFGALFIQLSMLETQIEQLRNKE
jgi:hypothetical protein